MNKLEKLIAEFCPEGVKYIELKHVCYLQNGFAFKSNKFRKKGKPIIRIKYSRW